MCRVLISSTSIEPTSNQAPTRSEKLPDDLYTGIWWYARFPNRYSGDGSVASKELGEFDSKFLISDLVKDIKAVKADSDGLKLQKKFYEEAMHPFGYAAINFGI